MFIKRPITLATGAGLLLAITGAALTAPGSYAAKVAGGSPLLAYDLAATTPSDAAVPIQPAASDVLQNSSTEQLSDVAADDEATGDAPTAATATVDQASVECMAKVVLHEAGNQPHEGKVAVAQTLVNRLRAGRFGGSICDVVNQKGQFFRIASFNPRRDTDGWQDAVEVAHQVLAGGGDAAAHGAMFFRASYAPANSFFRTRQRVTTVGGHIFYR